MQLNELSDYIGRLLEVARYKDYCPNGIQVEGRSTHCDCGHGLTGSHRSRERVGADASSFTTAISGAATSRHCRHQKNRISTLLRNDISRATIYRWMELGNNSNFATPGLD
jgi:hypothetical protein